MSFYRITSHKSLHFATLHNYGCTFRCCFCSYRLRSGADGAPGLSYPPPKRFLSVAEIEAALRKAAPEKVYFMGGEPTTAKELPELLAFAKRELGAVTRLGHTNGSRLPLPDLDGANVGFKAWSDDLHRRITGCEKALIYDNFSAACDAGLDMAANMVFVPGLVGLAEFEGLMKFLSRIGCDIPFHIMGYIPVPGQPYRRPGDAEMDEVLALCRSYLKRVDSSHLTSEEALDLKRRDHRFQVETIAGETE